MLFIYELLFFKYVFTIMFSLSFLLYTFLFVVLILIHIGIHIQFQFIFMNDLLLYIIYEVENNDLMLEDFKVCFPPIQHSWVGCLWMLSLWHSISSIIKVETAKMPLQSSSLRKNSMTCNISMSFSQKIQRGVLVI